MALPEYVICMECDTPTYVFEWAGGKVTEAQCPMCGNDDPTMFISEEELEELTSEEEDEE